MARSQEESATMDVGGHVNYPILLTSQKLYNEDSKFTEAQSPIWEVK
jgi:hypothetical protein